MNKSGKLVKKQSLELIKPSLWRVFFARSFDVIFASFFSFLLDFFLKPSLNDWLMLILVIGLNLLIILSYFVLLPFFLNGSSIGKLIFKLRLKSKNETKITLTKIFFRELIYIILPWLIMTLGMVIGLIIFRFTYTENSKLAVFLTSKFIVSLSNLTYLIWFAILGLSIIAQPNHLSGVDIKYQLTVLKISRVEESKNKKGLIKGSNRETNFHVHLKNSQPGNVDENEVEKILEEEKDYE